jgi:hypothetical protein
MSLELTTCPECGAPAELIDEGPVESTDGPVRVVRLRCAHRHWFLLDPASLARSLAAETPLPTPGGR